MRLIRTNALDKQYIFPVMDGAGQSIGPPAGLENVFSQALFGQSRTGPIYSPVHALAVACSLHKESRMGRLP